MLGEDEAKTKDYFGQMNWMFFLDLTTRVLSSMFIKPCESGRTHHIQFG